MNSSTSCLPVDECTVVFGILKVVCLQKKKKEYLNFAQNQLAATKVCMKHTVTCRFSQYKNFLEVTLMELRLAE